MGAEQSSLAPAEQTNAANGTKPGPRALVVCGPSGVGKGLYYW